MEIKYKNGSRISEANYSFPYMRTERKTFWENFALGIWNAKERKFLGRTKRMWGTVFIFYTVFYAVLAGLIAICMYGLMATIDERIPKYILDSSLIGTNPGVNFRPFSESGLEVPIVSYNATDEYDIRTWSDKIDEFLKEYNEKTLQLEGGPKQVFCNFTKYPEPGQACLVDMSEFGDCTAENQYAYQNSTPCFFIKLNKIYGWEPECYNDTNDLPKEMPLDLQEHIGMLATPVERNQIWITCDGETDDDKKAMGNISYSPGRGLPGYYYPYTNSPGYLSPLLSVQFSRPENNRTINIECRVWAKNIVYHKSLKDGTGFVRFQFRIYV